MKPPPTPTVNAVSSVMRLKGSAGAHVFVCDDDKERVVKFFDGGKMVVNEFLGHKICQFLELPVPGDAFVIVSQVLIDSVADLKNRGVKPGLHYGKEYDRRALDLERLTAPDPKQVQNASCLPGVILLNNLVYNTDTGNQNHLLTPSAPQAYTYTVVDLGNSAGGNWTPQSLQATSTQNGIVGTHPLLAITVTGIESFSPYLERAEALTREDLVSIVESIPPSWGVTSEEKAAWVEFILKRSKMFRGAVLVNTTVFPAWRKQA